MKGADKCQKKMRQTATASMARRLQSKKLPEAQAWSKSAAAD